MSCAAAKSDEADANIQQKEDAEDVGFAYVQRRSNDKRKARKGRQDQTIHADSTEEVVKRRVAIVEQRRQDLLQDEKLKSTLDRLFADHHNLANNAVRHGLALGLGSLRDSRSAQVQLAFFLLVCDRVQIKHREAYDPISTEIEVKVLEHFGIQSLTENRRGAHTLDHHTFVFMPHCAKTLYERFLRANWSANRLAMTLLCCNELERYQSGTHRKEAESNQFVCIQRSLQLLHVDVLPDLSDKDAVGHALSETAFQSFTSVREWLDGGPIDTTVDPSFWQLPATTADPSDDGEVI
jgi:hypothetical protein